MKMKSTFDRQIATVRCDRPVSITRSVFRRGLLLGLCLLLAACATTSDSGRDVVIPERAQARWDALLAADYATAYAYASPGYRSATSLTDFEIEQRLRRLSYTSAEVKEHACDEAVCTVNVFVGFSVVRPVVGVPEWKGGNLLEERWIFSDGNWWYLPEKR